MKSNKKASTISLRKISASFILAGLLMLQMPQAAFGADANSLGTQSGSAFNTNSGTMGLSNPFNSAPSNTSLNAGLSQESNNGQVKNLQESIAATGRSKDPQAEAADGGGGSGAGGGSSATASALLGQAVAMGLKTLATKAIGRVASVVMGLPVASNAIGDNFDRAANASDAEASVNAVQQIFGIPIGASFNGIAFCIVNGLITYIANSTIAWANTGFQGNPAFLQNPESFFSTLADRQASNFISSLAYNSSGVNVCQPFRVDLAIALSESYGAGQNNMNRFSCSMDQVGQNFANFANGGYGGGANINGYWENWNQMRQDQNNPWGAYIAAGEYMQAQIAVKQNTAKFELGLNNGFLNFKKCEDTAAAKKGDTSSCKTYTPGSLIESSLNDTLKLGKDRLVMATKIDQVITAVANALVKKALNTVLQKGN